MERTEKRQQGGQSGALSWRWKGGRYTSTEGYVLVQIGKGQPMADVRGYAYEHRLVAAKTLGRPLRTEEQVHHKDENRQNNDPSNLEVLTLPEHKVEHRILDSGRRLPGEENPMVFCRCGCGATFTKYDDLGRPRTSVTGHNRTGDIRAKMAVAEAIRAGISHPRDIAHHLDKSIHTVRQDLTLLRERGVVEPIGGGRWTVKVEAA